MTSSKPFELRQAVRRRDGDECRYCGKLVFWSGRRGKRSGTYYVTDGSESSTAETVVVACALDVDRISTGTELKLLPAPREPIYRHRTLLFFGVDVRAQASASANGTELPPAPDDQSAKPGRQHRFELTGDPRTDGMFKIWCLTCNSPYTTVGPYTVAQFISDH